MNALIRNLRHIVAGLVPDGDSVISVVHRFILKKALANPGGVIERSGDDDGNLAIRPCVCPLGARFVGRGFTKFVGQGILNLPHKYVCLTQSSPKWYG